MRGSSRRVVASSRSATHWCVRPSTSRPRTLERRTAHSALADVLIASPDRRAWHLAAAALGSDEAVARELDAAADRARARGAHSVAVAALERAAWLSEDDGSRGRRTSARGPDRVRARSPGSRPPLAGERRPSHADDARACAHGVDRPELRGWHLCGSEDGDAVHARERSGGCRRQRLRPCARPPDRRGLALLVGQCRCPVAGRGRVVRKGDAQCARTTRAC